MASRIVEVRDAVRDRLAAWIGLVDPGSATVTTRRRLTIEDGQPAARTVFVMPAGYSQIAAATKTEDLSEYTVAVVVVDRFTVDDLPTATDEWADELSAWVEANVFAPLNVIGVRLAEDVPVGMDPSPLLATADDEGLHCESATVDMEYDPDALQQFQLFWSEMTFAFREVR